MSDIYDDKAREIISECGMEGEGFDKMIAAILRATVELHAQRDEAGERPVAGEWDRPEDGPAILCLVDTGACVANVYAVHGGTWEWNVYNADCDRVVRHGAGHASSMEARTAAIKWARANAHLLDWKLPDEGSKDAPGRTRPMGNAGTPTAVQREAEPVASGPAAQSPQPATDVAPDREANRGSSTCTAETTGDEGENYECTRPAGHMGPHWTDVGADDWICRWTDATTRLPDPPRTEPAPEFSEAEIEETARAWAEAIGCDWQRITEEHRHEFIVAVPGVLAGTMKVGEVVQVAVLSTAAAIRARKQAAAVEVGSRLRSFANDLAAKQQPMDADDRRALADRWSLYDGKPTAPPIVERLAEALRRMIDTFVDLDAIKPGSNGDDAMKLAEAALSEVAAPPDAPAPTVDDLVRALRYTVHDGEHLSVSSERLRAALNTLDDNARRSMGAAMGGDK